jgi:hypothetical protein
MSNLYFYLIYCFTIIAIINAYLIELGSSLFTLPLAKMKEVE